MNADDKRLQDQVNAANNAGAGEPRLHKSPCANCGHVTDDVLSCWCACHKGVCRICRRPEVEHRGRNGHGFVAVKGEPPHRAAWSGNWRDEDNAPPADDTPPDTRSEVETLAVVLCRADESWVHHDATDDFPCLRCKALAVNLLPALAQHDAQVAAKALRAAERDLPAAVRTQGNPMFALGATAMSVRDWLREHADRIEGDRG